MNEQEFLKRGIEKTQQGDYVEAIKEFDRAIEVNPNLAQAYYRKGLALFDNRQIREAVDNYTLSLQFNTEQIEVYYSRAIARLVLGDFQGSMQDANHCISLNADSAQAYQLRATICMRLGIIDAARKNLKKAAEIYLNAKDSHNCRQCLEKIATLTPSQLSNNWTQTVDFEQFCQEILNKINQGKIRAALDDCDWLIQLAPDAPQVYYHRAVVREKFGDTVGAIADYSLSAQYFLTEGNQQEYQRLKEICTTLRSSFMKPNFSVAQQRKPNSFYSPQVSRTNTRPSSQKIQQLQHRLYSLIGNYKVAQRLVEGLKLSYPGMSEEWYLEKAIFDLERDRH